LRVGNDLFKKEEDVGRIEAFHFFSFKHRIVPQGFKNYLFIGLFSLFNEFGN